MVLIASELIVNSDGIYTHVGCLKIGEQAWEGSDFIIQDFVILAFFAKLEVSNAMRCA